MDPPDVGADRWWDGFYAPRILSSPITVLVGAADVLLPIHGELVTTGDVRIGGTATIRDAARWNGDTWRPLGEGPGGTVLAGTRHGDDLVCLVDGLPLRLRRWNGAEWTTLAELELAREVPSTTPPGSLGRPAVRAMTSTAGEIVIGGSFDRANGLPARGMVAWDGVRWRPLGDTSSFVGGCGAVTDFAIHDGALVAGGYFPGWSHSNGVARWDGREWHPVGVAPRSGSVAALAVQDGILYAAGGFGRLEGTLTPVDRLIRWNGAEWKSMTRNLPPEFYPASVVESSRGLLVTGSSVDDVIVIGPSTSSLRLWDGSRWTLLAEHVRAGVIRSAAEYGGELFVRGSFESIDEAGSLGLATLGAAGWRGAIPGRALHRIRSSSFDDTFGAAHVFHEDDEALIAGGRFTFAGERYTGGVARWADDAWQPLGTGTNGEVFALARWNNRIVAGGRFTRAGAAAALDVAAWDGSDWQAFGPGLRGQVSALADYRGALVAAGAFSYSGTRLIHNVARWDGAAWQPMANGLFPQVGHLLVHNNELLAAGGFNWNGHRELAAVARWTEDEGWVSLGTIRGSVTRLRIIDSALYATGSFRLSAAGGAPLHTVARWTGLDWIQVGDRTNLRVRDIAKYAGDIVIAVNYNTDSRVSGRLYRLVSGSWQPLSRALRTSPTVLAVHGGSLYCGGEFREAGDGRESIGIARWDGGTTAVVLEDFVAEAARGGGVQVRWRCGAGHAPRRIDLYRSDDGGGPWALQASLAGADAPAAGAWVDGAVAPHLPAWYRAEFVDEAGEVTVAGPVVATAAAFATALEPVAIATGGAAVRIGFRAGVTAPTDLGVYDVRGRRVRTLVHARVAAGRHVAEWDRRDQSGAAVVRGIYFVRLDNGGTLDTRKILVAGR